MGPKAISRCVLVVLFHGATGISDATCSFVMGLAPSASVLLAYSPDGSGANAERAEKAVQNPICHRILRGIRRTKEIKHIAISQPMQGSVCGFVQR
jgi:hypothetical protein